ncbi:MAG: flavodoxin family protein [Bacteroidaceae bacterium]|nr:flavodoxin family protein [Bacteroidaceae bacterium]
MKKIIIIDGGPRKTMNTASMLQKIAEGAASVSDQIEVKTVRLYDMQYKGCMSCMACKLKGKASNVCKFRDALTPLLEEVAGADGLAMGSPIYFSEVTAQLRLMLERLVFPWLSYNDYSLTAPKRMPVILTYTMNANTEQAKGTYQCMGIMEHCLSTALGHVEHVDAYNTYQVKNYDRYELAGFPEPLKRQYRDEHWEQDLQRAYDAGRRMAETITGKQ